MDMKDLEYLRKMNEEKYNRQFSGEEIKKIHNALHTNVETEDATEALDITADIIEIQSARFGVDEKFENITNDIIHHGVILGATEAVETAEKIDFNIKLKKENITDKTVNLVNPDGYSFLHEAIWESKSPKVINDILDKGGKFVGYNDTHPDEMVYELVERVTSHYEYQLSQPNGEKNVKNDLENMTILMEKGLAYAPENLDKLLSNPKLFEKYPETMKKMFNYDDNLQEKLEEVKNRKENKGKNEDYLQEKLKAVRASLNAHRRRPPRTRKGSEEEERKLGHNYRMGETGEITRKNLSEEEKPSEEDIKYGTKVQTEAAKKFMKEYRDR